MINNSWSEKILINVKKLSLLKQILIVLSFYYNSEGLIECGGGNYMTTLSIESPSFKSSKTTKNSVAKHIATNAALAVPLTTLGIIGHDIFEGGYFHPKRNKNITFKEYLNDLATDIKKNFKILNNKSNKTALALYFGSIYMLCFTFLSIINSKEKNN